MGNQYQMKMENHLLEFYYIMSDCIVALKLLNYTYYLYSTDVLHQTFRRLPNKYYSRWAEYCFNLRQHKELSLSDLELWLGEKILAAKEAYSPHKFDGKKIF